MENLVTRSPPPELYCPTRLAENLAVLSRLEPELAQRLSWPVDDGPVLFTDQGELRYVAHRTAQSLAVAPDLPEFGAPSLLILGLGAGDILDHALSHESSERITCWERDPWLLRLDLMRRDRRLELSTGRLRYCLGPDLLGLRGWDGSVLPHPILAAHYAVEIACFQAEKKAKRALLCVGKLFYRQLAHSLRAAGYEVWTLDVERQASEELERTAKTFQAEFILSINYTAGLAEFAAGLGQRLVVWEVDPCLGQIAPCHCCTEATWIWSFRHANVEIYQRAGFQNVAYLPLAADPEVRRPLELTPVESERYGAPVSFVGSSLLSEVQGFRAQFLGEHALWRGLAGDDGQAAALFEKLLSYQRTDFSSYRIPEDLESCAPGFRAHALARDGCLDPAIMVAEFAGAEKRLNYVHRLAPMGVVAWGDEGWAQLAQIGVEYRGSAGHADELTRIYNASSINLDINRIYQSNIITMRVFDVLAAGGFVLAEHSSALAEAFVVGHEVDSYHNLGELQEKIEHYLAHPEEAREIARRGRARVLREHTIEARLKHMLRAAGLLTPAKSDEVACDQ